MVGPSEPAPGIVEWRAGVQTRLHAGAQLGSAALCVIEQWCLPGTGAPTHTHFEVEELIVVLAGRAEFWVDDERRHLPAGESIRLPAGSWHGFENPGPDQLHLLAAFASAQPPVCYQERPELVLEVGGSSEQMLDQHRAIRSQGEDR